MIDQTAMTMGLAEPREATKWETLKVQLKTFRKNAAASFRTRRLLRASIALMTLGAVFASGWVSSQHITAPSKLCECPLKIEPPKAGKKGVK